MIIDFVPLHLRMPLKYRIMKNEFVSGDVVQLKSGSTKMAVEKIENNLISRYSGFRMKNR
jgi:hypothetical protein